MAKRSGQPTSSPKTSTTYGCPYISRESAQPLMSCHLISILMFQRQVHFHNQNLRALSNQTPNTHGCLRKKIALWIRKKLHRPRPLLKQLSEHLRSQGVSVLRASGAEMSKGRLSLTRRIFRKSKMWFPCVPGWSLLTKKVISSV